MTEQQVSLFDGIVDSRGDGFINPDGSLQGPFDPLLRNPALGDAIQKAGAQIRFNTSLSASIREIAILVCAQHWRANYEWWVHRKIAEAEGIDAATLDQILVGATPAQPDLAAVQTFLSELNQTGGVSDRTYESTFELLGEQGVVELTLLSGYYATISQLLNVFEVPLPEGETLPFPEPIV